MKQKLIMYSFTRIRMNVVKFERKQVLCISHVFTLGNHFS